MSFDYVGTEANGSVDGKLKTFNVAASHASVLAVGDLVRITGTASAAGVGQIDASTAAVGATGVINNVRPTFAGEQLSITHLPASTAGDVEVNVDSEGLYNVPVSNGPLVVANVGLNAPAVVTAATVNGTVSVSNMGVNATGVATTATLPLRIVALAEDAAGVLGERAIVRLNATTATAGATGV